MTDFPAVVYLKAKNPSVDDGASGRKDAGCGRENPNKSVTNHKSSMNSRKNIAAYKKLLEALNSVLLKKMDKIEGRLDILSDNSDILEEKIETLSSCFEADVLYSSCEPSKQSTEDYPEGSWLGFKNNPEMRVRCKITPQNLQDINRKCATPEKMALILLDHLFDRETQASSNLSGLGKHRKRQLDPLLIYGIKCHLIYRFEISEEDWSKIKTHLDAKCRYAFRKKKRISIQPREIMSSKIITTSNCFGSSRKDCKNYNSSNISSSDQEMTSENMSF